jgi:xanthine dehydrogenase accessory factor
MIGSCAKCQIILEHLRSDGYGDDALSRVYAPIGLDLGGPTPEEIAVAILAEVIAVRRGGSGTIRSR